ncbi:MAG: hypothetical protein FJ291_17790 [Planctomycetes bacterium]|nr:hypothetical protein [Planctomycetota bacterium]
MGISKETLVILIFLIPGFMSSALLNSLVVRRERDVLARVVEALVLSFIIYAAATLITGQSPVMLHETREGNVTTYSVTGNASFLVPVVFLAFLLPLGLGLMTTTDWHMKALRKCRITNKTSRQTTWLDVFMDQKRRVILHFSDGRRLHGWPMYYSETPEDGLLYLYDPYWFVPEENDWESLSAHGLFLVKRELIDWIEFLPGPGEWQMSATKEGEAPHEQTVPGHG